MFDSSPKLTLALELDNVTTESRKTAKRVFRSFGAIVRTTSKRSMKSLSKGKQKKVAELRKRARFTKDQVKKTALRNEIRTIQRGNASNPGEPPKAILGFVKKTILFDATETGVLMGPAGINRPQLVTKTLEHGGTAFVGKDKTPVKILPRPYMGPAFWATVPKLPQLWEENTNKGN